MGWLDPYREPAARLIGEATGDTFAWRLSLDRAREALGPRWDELGFEADGAWTKAQPEAAIAHMQMTKSAARPTAQESATPASRLRHKYALMRGIS